MHTTVSNWPKPDLSHCNTFFLKKVLLFYFSFSSLFLLFYFIFFLFSHCVLPMCRVCSELISPTLWPEIFSQQLEKSSGDLSTLTSSLKATDGALQRELDAIKDGTNDLANKFSKLRDRINQEIANKQVSVVHLALVNKLFIHLVACMRKFL